MFLAFFNASLLQTYIHGAPEGMRHWYSQHFISHEHGMNEDTGKTEVDESIISLKINNKKIKAQLSMLGWHTKSVDGITGTRPNYTYIF